MPDVKHSTLHLNRANLHRSFADITDFTPSEWLPASATTVDKALKFLADQATVSYRSKLDTVEQEFAANVFKDVKWSGHASTYVFPEIGTFQLSGTFPILFNSSGSHGIVRIYHNNVLINATITSGQNGGMKGVAHFTTTIRVAQFDTLRVALMCTGSGGKIQGGQTGNYERNDNFTLVRH